MTLSQFLAIHLRTLSPLEIAQRALMPIRERRQLSPLRYIRCFCHTSPRKRMPILDDPSPQPRLGFPSLRRPDAFGLTTKTKDGWRDAAVGFALTLRGASRANSYEITGNPALWRSSEA